MTFDPADLFAGHSCAECGRHKATRLLYLGSPPASWTRGPNTAPQQSLTGCQTCDEVITRHRCTGRPSLESMADGQAWTCECGTTWTAIAEPVVTIERRWLTDRDDEQAATPRG